MKNMVDERFELGAVICRLAGRPEYSTAEFGAFNTEYHKEVVKTFAPFTLHEAVEYAKKHQDIICYDKVLQFAVHITKVGDKFVFIDDINSLYGVWNEQTANEFLKLYNKFYEDTNYAEFFNAHIPLFEESTQEFIEKSYKYIDFEWFRKYIDPSNLRCIYSLSSAGIMAAP